MSDKPQTLVAELVELGASAGAGVALSLVRHGYTPALERFDSDEAFAAAACEIMARHTIEAISSGEASLEHFDAMVAAVVFLHISTSEAES